MVDSQEGFSRKLKEGYMHSLKSSIDYHTKDICFTYHDLYQRVTEHPSASPLPTAAITGTRLNPGARNSILVYTMCSRVPSIKDLTHHILRLISREQDQK